MTDTERLSLSIGQRTGEREGCQDASWRSSWRCPSSPPARPQMTSRRETPEGGRDRPGGESSDDRASPDPIPASPDPAVIPDGGIALSVWIPDGGGVAPVTVGVPVPTTDADGPFRVATEDGPVPTQVREQVRLGEGLTWLLIDFQAESGRGYWLEVGDPPPPSSPLTVTEDDGLITVDTGTERWVVPETADLLASVTRAGDPVITAAGFSTASNPETNPDPNRTRTRTRSPDPVQGGADTGDGGGTRGRSAAGPGPRRGPPSRRRARPDRPPGLLRRTSLGADPDHPHQPGRLPHRSRHPTRGRQRSQRERHRGSPTVLQRDRFGQRRRRRGHLLGGERGRRRRTRRGALPGLVG